MNLLVKRTAFTLQRGVDVRPVNNAMKAKCDFMISVRIRVAMANNGNNLAMILKSVNNEQRAMSCSDTLESFWMKINEKK